MELAVFYGAFVSAVAVLYCKSMASRLTRAQGKWPAMSADVPKVFHSNHIRISKSIRGICKTTYFQNRLGSGLVYQVVNFS